MNKMLVVIFDNETAANAGLQALRKLHVDSDITLYAAAVLGRDANGVLSLKKGMDAGPVGTGVGLAVGSMIGLLGGPLGLVVGAVTGAVAGAMRDFWVAGVSLDFIEETERSLQPGKVAVVAEVEEEWVIPVDAAIEAVGGRVFRRSRTEVAEAQFDHDIAAFKTEITELEAEAASASGVAKAKLETTRDAAKRSLDALVQRARQRADALKQQADAKAEVIKAQWTQSTGDAKARLEARVKHLQSTSHARGVKLGQAWNLTKEALAL